MDPNAKLSYIACDIPEGMTLEQWRAKASRPRRRRPWRRSDRAASRAGSAAAPR